MAPIANSPEAGPPPVSRPPSNRRRFLDACHGRPVDRPPVWLMRQAGRALPEYRRLKARHPFLELVRTPELAAEVTLQPVRRFPFDAAILFSDILVAAEGLGQGYQFQDGGGIRMEFPLDTTAEIQGLDVTALPERLAYIPRAVQLVKTGLADQTALLGFAGSPWTLANFMLEGGSAREFARAKHLFYSQPEVLTLLLEKLTAAVTRLLQMQIIAGVDAVQVFDSLGGLLSESAYEAASGRWIKQIIAGLDGAVPVIVFAKDVHGNWDTLAGTGARVLGVDCHVRLAEVRARLPAGVGVQGNLDPALLALARPETVAAETQRLLVEMRGHNGYIFNLGHGVPPQAKLENLAALVETVRHFT